MYVVDERLPPVLPYKSMLLEKGFLWLSFDIPASIKLLVVALGSNILQVEIDVLLPALVPLFSINPTATPSLVLFQFTNVLPTSTVICVLVIPSWNLLI